MIITTIMSKHTIMVMSTLLMITDTILIMTHNTITILMGTTPNSNNYLIMGTKLVKGVLDKMMSINKSIIIPKAKN